MCDRTASLYLTENDLIIIKNRNNNKTIRKNNNERVIQNILIELISIKHVKVIKKKRINIIIRLKRQMLF